MECLASASGVNDLGTQGGGLKRKALSITQVHRAINEVQPHWV
jgi:hypothetical protein